MEYFKSWIKAARILWSDVLRWQHNLGEPLWRRLSTLENINTSDAMDVLSATSQKPAYEKKQVAENPLNKQMEG